MFENVDFSLWRAELLQIWWFSFVERASKYLSWHMFLDCHLFPYELHLSPILNVLVIGISLLERFNCEKISHGRFCFDCCVVWIFLVLVRESSCWILVEREGATWRKIVFRIFNLYLFWFVWRLEVRNVGCPREGSWFYYLRRRFFQSSWFLLVVKCCRYCRNHSHLVIQLGKIDALGLNFQCTLFCIDSRSFLTIWSLVIC